MSGPKPTSTNSDPELGAHHRRGQFLAISCSTRSGDQADTTDSRSRALGTSSRLAKIAVKKNLRCVTRLPGEPGEARAPALIGSFRRPGPANVCPLASRGWVTTGSPEAKATAWPADRAAVASGRSGWKWPEQGPAGEQVPRHRVLGQSSSYFLYVRRPAANARPSRRAWRRSSTPALGRSVDPSEVVLPPDVAGSARRARLRFGCPTSRIRLRCVGGGCRGAGRRDRCRRGGGRRPIPGRSLGGGRRTWPRRRPARAIPTEAA